MWRRLVGDWLPPMTRYLFNLFTPGGYMLLTEATVER